MTQDVATGAQAAAFERLLAGNTGLLFAVGAGLTALAVLLFVLILLSRRQQRRDIREVTVAVESLRSGRPSRPAELDPRSPFAILGDAVNRLGQDLAARHAEVEGSGEGFRALLDAARDFAVVTADSDLDVRSFSPGATQMFGWEDEALMGRQVAVLFETSAWKDLLPKLGRKSLRDRGVEARSVLVRHDGSTFHGQVAVRLLRGGPSEARGFLFLIKDVDADVKVEEELRQSEARYRGLVEGMPEAVMVLRDGRIAYANRALADLLGFRLEDLTGMPLRDRVTTRDVLAVQGHLVRLEKGPAGERCDLHVTLLTPEAGGAGEIRLSLMSAVLDGSPAVVATATDETMARRLEAELVRNESRLDAVLEATSDAVLSLADLPGGAMVRTTNRAFLDLFGLRESQVLGATEGDFLRLLRERGEGAEAIAAFLAEAHGGMRRETFSFGAVSPRVLELTTSPLINRRGAPLGRVVVCRDASRASAEERRLEDEAEGLRVAKSEAEASHRRLVDAHGELVRKVGETERLNQELRTLDQMKTHLLANVTHELQTPLVSVRGYTEMILKERLGSINEEQRKGLGLSLKNIDRLISMIDNLLAFARMDREAADLSISPFTLRILVVESVEMLRSKIEAKRIRLAISFEEPGVVIHADREKILQVLLNVLSNAVKFNRDGGEVGVEVRKGKPGLVAVQIKDTGIGIPEADLEKIFDRFYRVGATGAAAPDGTGLGLSIVRDILRLHGCSIRADSKVGRGTTFSFTLPLAAEGIRVEDQDAARPVAAAGGSQSVAQAEPAPPPAAGTESPGPPRSRFRIIRKG